ncbi:unnamed protein product [Lampetra planeri]
MAGGGAYLQRAGGAWPRRSGATSPWRQTPHAQPDLTACRTFQAITNVGNAELIVEVEMQLPTTGKRAASIVRALPPLCA